LSFYDSWYTGEFPFLLPTTLSHWIAELLRIVNGRLLKELVRQTGGRSSLMEHTPLSLVGTRAEVGAKQLHIPQIIFSSDLVI